MIVAALAVSMTMAPSAYAEEAAATITGHVTKEATGAVTVNLFTTGGIAAGQAISTADGDYAFPGVAPGTYKMQFGFAGRFQWAHQKLGFSSATVVSVAAGDHVVVDETMLLPGYVEIHAKDAVTGQPVDTFCAGVYQDPYQCGATGGVMRLTDFDGGPRTVYIKSSDGLHARQAIENVSITLGQVTRLDVTLKPTAAITTTVVDRATGDPVPYVCVAALTLTFGGVDDQTCQYGVNYTDELGRVTLAELPAADYTLLVVPEDGVHGIQWAGATGGTGSQYQAQILHTIAGAPTVAPQVRLDPAASITGTVRDADTGAPISDGCAQVLPSKTAYGIGKACGYSGDGTYTLSNLGPYKWPVLFSNFYTWAGNPYVGKWSGNATDRKAATLIQAGKNQPTVLDATLTHADAPFTLKVTSADGQAYTGWFSVDVYNARTGDFVQSSDTSQGWTIHGVGMQNVHIHYVPNSPWRAGWVGGADYASADTIKLRSDRTVTVKIVLPDPA
ncbi:carboxypeptidase regulatory-like domain-containing protein [Dactylosporangium sp. CA-139066]|uniref:carboxypeptidase regulatory-like domain-containing protein n=1 Tax=Dactylosporangium sp. CA-139066 TaxID=3239930 RepID=UPI003D91E691